ncbi:hypothetical protein ACFLWO_04130 [Chloroflexota bacterium]
MELDKICIDKEIRDYFTKLSGLNIPIQREMQTQNTYRLLKFIKRYPVEAGPYPDVSLFENGNRIFSDLVILFGVRRLLYELHGQFPFSEYRVALGTQQGVDIAAARRGITLAGEAFSVARTFFPTKRRSALKSLSKTTANYKILMFNSDAVLNPAGYDLRTEQDVCNLVIDVEEGLKELNLL